MLLCFLFWQVRQRLHGRVTPGRASRDSASRGEKSETKQGRDRRLGGGIRAKLELGGSHGIAGHFGGSAVIFYRESFCWEEAVAAKEELLFPDVVAARQARESREPIARL